MATLWLKIGHAKPGTPQGRGMSRRYVRVAFAHYEIEIITRNHSADIDTLMNLMLRQGILPYCQSTSGSDD